MARPLPPLTWFRAFESSARNLSFTAAAEELGLTQSAISQQVNLLEKRFGCLLFIRKSRGLALTDEGRRLVPTVAKAMATLRIATDSFDTETDKRLLTVATSVSIAQWYLAPRMAAFSKSHEDVAIRLMTKVWPDEFSNSEVDVEIRFEPIKSFGKSTSGNSMPLGSNQMVVVGSPDLLGETGSSLYSADDIMKHPLIQVVGTSDTWQAWAESRHYLGEIRPTVFVDSHGMAVDLARSKAGIALTSRAIAAPSLCEGALVVADKMEMMAQDGYHLSVYPAGKNELAARFARWLADEISQCEAAIPC